MRAGLHYMTLILLVGSVTVVFGDGGKSGTETGMVVLGDTMHMVVNRVDLAVGNDGFTGLLTESYYPAGSGLTFLFGGGIEFSGIVNGQLRASWITSTPRAQEWQPGLWGMDPVDPLARFYAVSSNDGPGSAAYLDWADAVSLGAEFVDMNGDGVYDPNVDRPPLLGDKTIWTVINDGVPLANRHFGTEPMGLEIQQTIWAYRNDADLGDAVIFHFKVINAGIENVDSLIFSVFTDPDLGDYQDDLIGCDTLLDLGYAYNDGPDNLYGLNPPAFGIKVLQGATVPSPGDTAFVYRGPLRGVDTIIDHRTVPMTAFMTYSLSNILIGVPSTAQEARYYQIGGLDISGNPINPTQFGTGGTASTNPKFFYSGDPVTGSGWRENAPDDKLFLVNSGPFQLAAGDTQDIMAAYVLGRGADALNSLSVLRHRAQFLKNFSPYGRLLSIAVQDTVGSVDSIFVFRPVFSSLTYGDTIESVTWQLLNRPGGSVAQLLPGPGFQATLDPDLTGSYTIGLQASITGGFPLADTLTIAAVNNHPPTARLTLSDTELSFGSIVRGDAGASTDPDGDSLSFAWNLPPWVIGNFPDTAQVDFTPIHVGSGNAEVTVSDAYFSRRASQVFQVLPDSSGLSTTLHTPDLTGVTRMQYVNGQIFTLDFQTLNIFDANGSPNNMHSQLIDGIDFSSDGSLLIAYGYTPNTSLYSIDANYQLSLEAVIPVDVLQFPDHLVDVHLRFPYLFLPIVNIGQRELKAYDVSNPAAPNLIDTYRLAPIVRDLAFADTLGAFYSPIPNVGLVVLDLSDPADIRALDSLWLSTLQRNLAVGRGKVYLLNGASSGTEITVVDASQPDHLQVASTITIAPAIPGAGFDNPILEMAAFGDTLLAALKYGIKLYDVSDPAAPREIAHYHSGLAVPAMTWNRPQLFMVQQGNTLFGTGYYSLHYDSTLTGIAQTPHPALPASIQLFQNYPNPFNPATTISFDLPHASRITLHVYDVLGRKVKTLADGQQAAGRYRVQWDGTNDAGQPVASGVYFYRLTVLPPLSPRMRGDERGVSQTRKMLLVR